MSNVKYTKAQRLALAVKRDAELVERRTAQTEREIAADLGCDVGADVVTTSCTYGWAAFVALYRAGDVLNAHRAIIARDGAAR